MFVASHVGVGRRVQGSDRICRVSCGRGFVEFKALLVFVRSHVGVSRRVQGSVRVCRVSCESGP